MQSTEGQYPVSTYLPRDVVYFDGTSAVLPKEYVLKEENLRLFVPKEKIEAVVNALKSSGFEPVSLEFYKGEEYSLSMKIGNIWELHVRIYQNGLVDGHIEVSSDYFEHLQHPTIPSIFEVFEFYRTAYDKLHIFDSVSGKWIKEVRTLCKVTLNPPNSLIQWEPVAVVGGALITIGIIAYALSRLDKGGE